MFFLRIRNIWNAIWQFLVSLLIYDKKCPEILYKDDKFIFLSKPFDMMINSNDTSKYTVQTFLKQKFPQLIKKNLVHDFYFPHRLDFATSGVLCVPLCKRSCKVASEAFEYRLTKKYYVALVRGHVSKEFIHVNESIGDDSRETDFKKMCTASNPYCLSSRCAETFILTMETGFYENYPATKILLRPISGRRHQLRVHCCYLGHTIIGDYTYSNRRDVTPHRMYLHSIRLVLPNENQILDVQTSDPFLDNQSLKKWIPVKVFNLLTLHSYVKLENFSNSCK